MYTQNIIINNQVDISELFSRMNNNSLSFDTYFNSLSYDAINKYLSGNKCVIKFKYKGTCNFNICLNSKNNKKILFEEKLFSNEYKEYISKEIDLSTLEKGGYIYPSFSSIDNSFDVKDIKYEVETIENKTEIIIVICTYKREEYILRNIKKLRECKSFIKKVIVVDNGNTLINKIKSDDYINIIPNKNLGGSGGFTRGMLEAKKIGCTHIFLMDDDISFLNETLERSYNFIKSLKEDKKNSWLGYSMLLSDKPTIQSELGGYWNGIKVHIHRSDLSLTSSLLKNNTKKPCDYSAWWSLIIPVSAINDIGLPLPFFIKFDDIEYGMRRKDEEIILTNGYGVWHDNFVYKYSLRNTYCEMRNSLITNSIINKKALFKSLIRFIGQYLKALAQLKFEKIEIINYALNDFLKGPIYFEKTSYNFTEYLKSIEVNKKFNIFYIFKYIFILFSQIFKLLSRFKKVQKDYFTYSNIFKTEEWWNKTLSIRK